MDGVLTAISQYRHLKYFPRLSSNENLFGKLITRFVNREVKHAVKGLFPKDDYIVDIAITLQKTFGVTSILETAVLDESCVEKCWVVEVNPFFETTDGCLFSWSKDIDIILDSSVQTPVIRTRNSPPKGASSLIYGTWKEILDEL